MQITIDSFFILRRRALEDLKGKFTREELTALADMFNATTFDPAMAQRNVLIAEAEDSETYNSTLTRFNVDKEIFFGKLKKLTEIHAFWLIFKCWNFWYNGQNNANPDLEKWISQLI